MKIAYFSDSYLPYTSGVVTSMTTFAHGLEQRGHDIYVYAPSYPDTPDDPNDRVVRIPSLPFPAYNGLRMAIPHPFVDYDPLEDVDIIHAHSCFAMGLTGLVKAKNKGAALVLTVHSIYEDYFSYYPVAPHLLKNITREFTAHFCKASQCVIAPSHYVLKRLEELGVTTRIEVIPTGVNLDLYQPVDRETWRIRHGLDPAKRVLLYVGRLAKEKNISLIIQAAAKVMSLDENVVLVIAGDGPDRGHLEQEADELGVGDRVLFLGMLDTQAVVAAYQAAEIFVFASTMETQGLTILEAMAGSLPVVAVDAPATRELVTEGQAGYLTPANVEPMAARITHLLTHPDLIVAMGEQARLVAEQYSGEKMVERLEKVYRSLIAERAVSSALSD
ncbi:MAG: glycosyltransferase [Bacillota bacterium]